MSPTGLRERKKAATRQALHLAALELASARGVAAVTVEDVAAAAGVSPRTFFNYFAAKEEAFVADDLDRGARFVARVQEAPDGVPLWELLHGTATDVFAAQDVPAREQALKQALVRDSPEVAGHVLAAIARLQEQLVVELARRLGPAAPPLQARLLANAVVAALRSAAETWLSEDGRSSDFPSLLSEAFTALAPSFRSA